MASVTLNITEFRTIYPAFADDTKYPDATIERAFSTAEIFISNQTNCYLNENQLKTVLYLMTAHLLQFQTNTLAGNTAGVVTSASIDKISVTIAEPKNKGEFSYFLNQSPYGQELLALFKVLSLGGFSVGGRPETLAFRKVNGAY